MAVVDMPNPLNVDWQGAVYPLRAGFCHGCTLVQIDHTIPKEEMFADYPYVSGTTSTLIEHFASSSARLLASVRTR